MYFSQIVFHISHEVVDNAFVEGGFEGWLCQTGLSLPHYKTSSTRPLQGRRWFKMQFVCTLIKAGKDKRMSGEKGQKSSFLFSDFLLFLCHLFSSPSTFNVDFCLVFLWPWLIFSISDPRALKRSNIQQKLEGCQSWMKTLSTLLTSQKKCI